MNNLAKKDQAALYQTLAWMQIHMPPQAKQIQQALESAENYIRAHEEEKKYWKKRACKAETLNRELNLKDKARKEADLSRNLRDIGLF